MSSSRAIEWSTSSEAPESSASLSEADIKEFDGTASREVLYDPYSHGLMTEKISKADRMSSSLPHLLTLTDTR